MRRKDKGYMWCQNPPGPLKNKTANNMKTKKIMLDYKKLRKEFKEVLSKIVEVEIESWLKFDEERMDDYTKEGKDEIEDINPTLSHTEYSICPTQSEYPKVMEVSPNGREWYKRVVFAEKGGRFIAWSNAETFEGAEDEISTCAWYHVREIQEPREISIQEIADKFGIPVEEVRIKK